MHVVLNAVGLKYIASPQPIINSLTPQPISLILLIAVNSLVWWGLCFIQVILILLKFFMRFVIFDKFYKQKIVQYIDTLSISNISLIILDEPGHGHYIHGLSSHGYSDINMKELNENLRKEEVCFVLMI